MYCDIMSAFFGLMVFPIFTLERLSRHGWRYVHNCSDLMGVAMRRNITGAKIE